MSSSPGLLCLKWNNHMSAFDKLLNNLHLTDVYSDGTIVCHGKFYPVHRFVLSTCSEYFEEIFCQSINLKSKHPFIIVKDIHPPQMEALLNYMYMGEVNVPQEMLPELIKAAEAFKIKGLAVPDDEPPQSKFSVSRDRKRSGADVSSPRSQVKKCRRVDDNSKSTKINSKSDDEVQHSESDISRCYSSNSNQNAIEEFFTPEILTREVKSEPTDLPEYKEPVETSHHGDDHLPSKELVIKDEKSYGSYTTAEPFPPFKDDESLATDDRYDLAQASSWDNSQAFDDDNNLEDDDSAQGIYDVAFGQPAVSAMIEDGQHFPSGDSEINSNLENRHKCLYCSYTTDVKTNLKQHLKRHSGERPFACPHCSYRARQKFHVKRHIATHTGDKRFHCQHCPYKAIEKKCLLLHLRKHKNPH